jgi:hypothetical protein
MKRHIAKTNLDQRCVVLFMQIPGRESHALICPTDALPPRYEQAVMDVVESPEGQADPTLAGVIGRRLLPDTGENLLEALHTRGYLVPVPVENVYMLPMPNMPFPLRQIIEQMGGTVPQGTQSKVVDTNAEVNKFNPHANINQMNVEADMTATAQNLIVEASMLENDARAKRERAYAMAPSLRPQPVVLKETADESAKPAKKPAKAKAKQAD